MQKKLAVYSVLKMCCKYMAKPNKQSVQFFVILWARPHELLTPSRGKAPPSAALRGAVVTLKRRSVWLGLPLDASRTHALQLFLSSYVCVTRGPLRRAPLAARSGPFPTVLAHVDNDGRGILLLPQTGGAHNGAHTDEQVGRSKPDNHIHLHVHWMRPFVDSY